MENKNLTVTPRNFYNVESRRELFETIDPKNINNFLKKKKEFL